jgi:hypothetical protein
MHQRDAGPQGPSLPSGLPALGVALRELAARPAPPLPPRLAGAELVRALFVPEVAVKPGGTGKEPEGSLLIAAADLLDRSRPSK